MAQSSKKTGGSMGAQRNFSRLMTAFPRIPGAGTAAGAAVVGTSVGLMERPAPPAPASPPVATVAGVLPPPPSQPPAYGQVSDQPVGWGPPPIVGSPPLAASMGGYPPVSDTRPFLASEVFNKVAILCVMAVAAGTVGFLMPVSAPVMMVSLVVACGVAMVGIFRPQLAKVMAPIYALTEGLALGIVSQLYDAQSHGIIPAAVILTSVVFFATLMAYRTGLVRVTNKFIMATVICTIGLFAVCIAVIFGLTFPGISANATTYLVFGIIYIVVAVMNLFVDFEMVNRCQQAGVVADAEWYAALIMMFSIVMIYLGMLRVLAGRR